MSTNKMPDAPWVRLQDAVTYWEENMPTVANAVPQRDRSHVKAGEVTYLLPPPAREFADTPELDPNIIAMREVAAAEKGRDLDVDVLRPDPDAANAMYEFDCKLSEAARDQRVQFRGKRDTSDASDHETIPFGYFSTSRGFCFGSEIEAFPYPMDDEALLRDAVSGKVVVWHDVFVNRDDFLKWIEEDFPEFYQSNIASLCHGDADLDAAQISKTGAPGRPTAMHLVSQELQRRVENGEVPKGASARKISQDLAEWYKNGPRKKQPKLPPIAFDTIRKSLGADLRKAKSETGRN